MSDSELKKEEEESFLEGDRDQPIPPQNVVAFNELRSCADLSRMYRNKKLEIQPDFQREVVWAREDQSRFIDSLVKQLPIPSMCFSLDYTTQKWKVIDGLQRMSTITGFLGDHEWKITNAEDIHPLLRDSSNLKLKGGNEHEQKLYSIVEDVTVPITVIRCSYDEPSHMRYLFTIFHRLNSGGIRLNNQEIRNCIYSGSFNDFLKQFDKSDAAWLLVKKRIWGNMNRFRSVEILLRALAFSKKYKEYDGNLAKFLNDFMHSTMKAGDEALADFEQELKFMSAGANEVLATLGAGKRSLTFVESVLVSLITNRVAIESLEQDSRASHLRASANRLLQTPSNLLGARYALSSATTVKDRLKEGIAAFAN
jgi:Protein of unknown function DUF262